MLLDSKLTMEQFIDFCILCGCDYTSRISNIGPVRAYKLLQEHNDILQIMAWIRSNPSQQERYKISADFSPLVARSLFTRATVQKEGFDIDWQPINQQALKEFLIEKEFSTKRIMNWLEKAEMNSYY